MSTNPPLLARLDLPDIAKSFDHPRGRGRKLMAIFGTRPEVIKLAPVIRQLETFTPQFKTVNVTSAQHTDLLYPFLRLLHLRVEHNLQAMAPGQTPNQVSARVISKLDPLLAREQPDLILVQGDTTTALAGALAGFHRGIPVAHVEAGLRSGCLQSPYPEEMNRRLISELASYHFAATTRNRETLLAEGVAEENIFVTGNPVVDSLKTILSTATPGAGLRQLLEQTEGLRRVVLTTHRRESFGEVLSENLRVMRRFVEQQADVALVFPVHPNPAVAQAARSILSGHPRIHLLSPLSYDDFIVLLSKAWLIVSDSGGVQEEAPTLGKPLLILRENTERPEVIESGVARLVGGEPQRLAQMLAEASQAGSWVHGVQRVRNPFGQGDSSKRIARIVAKVLRGQAARDLKVA